MQVPPKDDCHNPARPMTAMSPILLLTRPEPAASRFLAELHSAGLKDIHTCISPLFEIVPTGPLPRIPETQTIVFTSANAVKMYLALGGRAAGRAYTVGQTTDQAALKAGFQTLSANGNADDLVALITQQPPTGSLLHVHGRHTRGAVAQRIEAAGVPIDTAEIYEQSPISLTKQALACLAGSQPVIVPLFSPRTARLFAIANNPVAPLYIGCMSSAVAEEVNGLVVRKCLIARHPDQTSMTKVVLDLVSQARSLEG